MTDEKNTPEQQPEPETETEADEPKPEADEAKAEADEPKPEASPEPQPVLPPPPTSFPPRRLMRRAEGKILGGVCTGLAAYLGLDPVLVRVGFVLAAVLGGGAGVVAYFVLWLVMPMAPEGEPMPEGSHIEWFDSSSVWRWTAIGLIVLAAVVLSRDIWHFHGGLVWGLLLLGVGIALWSREFRGRNGHTPRPPATTQPVAPRQVTTYPLGSPPATPSSPGQPITGGSGITTPLPPMRSAPSAPTPPASPAQRRPPSVLGRLVVGAAALAIGVLVLLGNLGVLHVTPRLVFAAVLCTIGLGLLVGTWWGRARWLIFPGIVVALLLGGSAALPANFHAGAGNIVWAPTKIDDVRTHYAHGAGNALLDLTNVTFDSQPRTIRVELNFGNLRVLVPEKVRVVASAHVRGGNLSLFGKRSDGFEVHDSQRVDGDPKFGQLTLVTDVAFGNTTVKQDTPGVHDLPGPGPRNVRVQIGPPLPSVPPFASTQTEVTTR